MQDYYYNPEVQVLLEKHSEEREQVIYNSNPFPFLLPKVGPRPPYYCYPRYEPYFPKI